VLAELILLAEEKSPPANEVVAGWTGFVVFIGLILAVAFLGWSLTRQLKKADRAAEAGLYDPSDERRPDRRAGWPGESGGGTPGPQATVGG
jgi:hypothetical protein